MCDSKPFTAFYKKGKGVYVYDIKGRRGQKYVCDIKPSAC